MSLLKEQEFLKNLNKEGGISLESIEYLLSRSLFAPLESSFLSSEELENWDLAQELIPKIKKFFGEKKHLSRKERFLAADFYREIKEELPSELISSYCLKTEEFAVLQRLLPNSLSEKKREILKLRLGKILPHLKSAVENLKTLKKPHTIELEELFLVHRLYARFA